MSPTPEEHRRIYEEQKARFEKARLAWTDLAAAKAGRDNMKRNLARAITKLLKVLSISVAVVIVGFYGSAVVAGVIGALSGDQAGDWELHMRDNAGKWHNLNAELKAAPLWTLHRCEAWGRKAKGMGRGGGFADQAACKDLKTGRTVRFVP
jgi:hypothetical protein